MTFLRNHVGQMVAIDFFTVPTLQLRVLYVFVILAHDRRRVLHLSRNTRLPRGRHSSSWRHFPTTVCLATWCAIVMGSTDATSPRELMEWVSASSDIGSESLAELLCGTDDRKHSPRML